MQKDVLEKANELDKKIKEIDSFISCYQKTWKRGILKIFRPVIRIGHKGYGYYKEGEMDCDKELSEIIYQALLEYQAKIHQEFELVGKEENNAEKN